VTKGGRAEREDVETAGEGFGETNESLAVTGRERDAAPGDPEEIRQRRSGTHEIPKRNAEARSQKPEFGLRHPISG
jgi:hypothetical protein